MGMTAGARGSIQGEINVTPLIDVVLVLLIIMMVVMPMMQMGHRVELPAGGGDPGGSVSPLVVRIDGDGQVSVLGRPVEEPLLRDAIAAGVTAYVVAGLAPERVKPVLEVAMARFQHEEGLRQELAEARTQLNDRKVIERAKGILMSRQGCSESQAYDRLRKTAMDKGLRLAEVAQRVIDVADMLG